MYRYIETVIKAALNDRFELDKLSGTLERFGNSELKSLLTDLGALFKESDDYNDDFLKPTNYALVTTWDLLEKAGKSVRGPFPLGTVYADGNGGVRIEWIRPSRELRLVIPSEPSGQRYIYHEEGTTYDADYDVSAINLRGRKRISSRRDQTTGSTGSTGQARMGLQFISSPCAPCAPWFDQGS